jgi:hypothetical protein
MFTEVPRWNCTLTRPAIEEGEKSPIAKGRGDIAKRAPLRFTVDRDPEMTSIAPQKANLENLREALNAAHNSLRRDECGTWRLNGSRGHVYGDGDGWLLYVRCRSGQHWIWTKKRLAFCRVTQDGDDEGCLHLDRLPSSEEAEEVRHALGLRQTKEVVIAPNAFGCDNRGTVGPYGRNSRQLN